MKLLYMADEDDAMLKAAQALAELARCSKAPTTLPSSEDEEVAAFHENKHRMAATALVSGVNDRSATKLRHNLSEADKEERRLRRVLANRESARQTIRRRQATHMELMRKADDLSRENESLKKERELAVKAYNSLESRNRLLKIQVANAKKAGSSDIDEEPM